MKKILSLVVLLISSYAMAQAPNPPTMGGASHSKKKINATATACTSLHCGNLSWTAPSGGTAPTGYNVYRTLTANACSTTPDSTGKCPAPNANTACTKAGNTTATTYQDNNLSASTTYNWTVTATASTGESCSSNQASGTTGADPIPSAPTGLSVTAQ